MAKRRVLGALGALGCVGMLSACSFLPNAPTAAHDDSEKVTAVQMQHIADAVKHQDASELKSLFSPHARANAFDLDGGLKYFLSVLPAAEMSWGSEGTSLVGDTANFQETDESFGHYKVVIDGKKYQLSFADISINTAHPDTVGIYALGVVPASENGYTASGTRQPFDVWAGQFGIKNHEPTGHPGVYVPEK